MIEDFPVLPKLEFYLMFLGDSELSQMSLGPHWVENEALEPQSSYFLVQTLKEARNAQLS